MYFSCLETLFYQPRNRKLKVMKHSKAIFQSQDQNSFQCYVPLCDSGCQIGCWSLISFIHQFCFSPTSAIPKVPRIILLPFNYPVSHLAKTYPHLVTFCSLILTKLITCYTSTHFVETLYLLPDLIHRNFKDYNLKQRIKYQYVGGFSDGVWN